MEKTIWSLKGKKNLKLKFLNFIKKINEIKKKK